MKKETAQTKKQNKAQDEEITIAYRIKTLREYKNLTQDELAKRAGYNDKSSISKIENSKNNISLKKVKKIAEALDVPPAKLLGDDETDTRIQVLADAAEKDREKIPPEIKQAMDDFRKRLNEIKREIDKTHKMVQNLEDKERHKKFIANYNNYAKKVDSKTSDLQNMFNLLEDAIQQEDVFPDAPEDTGD